MTDNQLLDLTGIGPNAVAILNNAGFKTLSAVAEAKAADLVQLEGFGPVRAANVIKAAKVLVRRRPVSALSSSETKKANPAAKAKKAGEKSPGKKKDKASKDAKKSKAGKKDKKAKKLKKEKPARSDKAKNSTKAKKTAKKKDKKSGKSKKKK